MLKMFYIKVMVYLFALAIALFNCNTDFLINNCISNQSFLTIQLSASSSHQESVNLSYLTLEESYRQCLEDLQTIKLSLEEAITRIDICKADESALETAYGKKNTVCKLMEDDYKKYCVSKPFKPPALEKDLCRTLLENIKTCLDEKRNLGSQLNDKIKNCQKLQKDIDEYTDMYSKINKKCSQIESKIYRSRSYTLINVVKEEQVMDKPLSKISRSDVNLLMTIVEQTQAELAQCLEKLNELSQRLAEKADEMYQLSEQITSALGGAISKKGILGKKKGKSNKILKLEQKLDILKEEKLGVQKLQLSQENACRNLQRKLTDANQRLEIAESQSTTPEGRPERCGCFDRFTAFVSRTCRRFTSCTRRFTRRVTRRVTRRFTRNNDRSNRRASTRS